MKLLQISCFDKVMYFLWIGLLFMNSQSFAKRKEQTLIKDVHILTNNQKLKNKLRPLLQSYKNLEINQINIDRIKIDINRYLLSNRYRNSEISESNISKRKSTRQVFFTIKHPYQYQFIFQNNQHINTMHLLQAIRSQFLSYQSNFIQTKTNQLMRYYQERAFHQTQITAQTQTDKENYSKIITFHIQEGKQLLIKKLSISGVLSKTQNFYTDIFYQYATPSLRNNLYVKKELDITLKQWINHLRRSGFINAKIQYKNIQIKKNYVFIDIILNENTPLRIKNIKITGANQFSTKEIQKIIGLKKRGIFHLDQFELGIRKLTQLYKDKGFLHFKISNQDKMIQMNQSLKSASIHIHLQEGHLAKVSQIIVKGNKDIQSDVIIHSSGIKKGMIMTPKQIKKSIDFLNELSLFSQIQIQPISVHHQKTLINITVKEKKFRFFRLGGRLSSQQNLSIQIPLEYNAKNFFNKNNSVFTLSTNLGSNVYLFYYLIKNKINKPIDLVNHFSNFFEYNFSASYKTYYLWNTRWSSQVSYSRSKIISSMSFDQSTQSTIKNWLFDRKIDNVEWLKSDKFTFQLEKKFDLNTVFTWKVFEIDLQTAPFLLEAKKSEVEIIPLTGGSLLIDRRDNIFFPHSGYFFFTEAEYSPPIIHTASNIHFFKIQSTYQFYIPLWKKRTILAHSIQSGWLKSIGSFGFPANKMLFLGGSNSLRGFDGTEYSRIPNKKQLPIQSATSIIKKDSVYGLLKSELRFPLFKNNLSGAIFYDIGWIHYSKVKLSEPYWHSAGFGFHYLSPIGPLVIEIGMKLNQMDSTWNLYSATQNLFYNFSMGVF